MHILLAVQPERTIKSQVCRILFGRSNLVQCPYCTRTGCIRRDEKFQCRRCGRAWSLTSLTWLKGMKLNWQQLWGLVWCFINKVPIDQTQKLLSLSKPTVYLWYGKFRLHLPAQEAVRLEAIVQVDEAYFGCRKKGVALLAAKQKHTSRVACRVLSHNNVDKQDMLPFIRQHIVPTSHVCTDGAGIYRGMGKHWPITHQYDIHKKGQFEHTSEIEGFFGSLRTFIRRMYHHVTIQKLPEVIQEYQCRLMLPDIFSSPFTFLQNTLPHVSFA